MYGLTGTLGTSKAQELLKKVYKLDLVFIPTYKEKQFEELPGIVAENEEEWLATVVARVKQEAARGRAVLVVCESINAAGAVEEALCQANVKKIKCYTHSDNDEISAVAEKVQPGDVIVATTLAGRGMDLKATDEVEANGGLFVLPTFLPRGKRQEDQIRGRTSRQGNQGSAQLVINQQDAVTRLSLVCPPPEDAEFIELFEPMEFLKEWRDRAEEETLDYVKEFELKKIVFKDELFTQFCAFTQTLRDVDDNPAKLDDLEEQWGFWLKNTVRAMAAEDTVNEVKIRGDFEDFMQQAEADYRNEEIKNPSHWVKLGNSRKHEPKLAKAAYQKAIEQDPDSAAAAEAHYKLARQWIHEQNKAGASAHLQRAKLLIEERLIPQLEAKLHLLYLTHHQNGAANSEQVQAEIHLFKIRLAHIDQNLAVLNSNPQRDIEITATKRFNSFFEAGHAPDDEIKALNIQGCFDVV